MLETARNGDDAVVVCPQSNIYELSDELDRVEEDFSVGQVKLFSNDIDCIQIRDETLVKREVDVDGIVSKIRGVRALENGDQGDFQDGLVCFRGHFR